MTPYHLQQYQFNSITRDALFGFLRQAHANMEEAAKNGCSCLINPWNPQRYGIDLSPTVPETPAQQTCTNPLMAQCLVRILQLEGFECTITQSYYLTQDWKVTWAVEDLSLEVLARPDTGAYEPNEEDLLKILAKQWETFRENESEDY